MFNWLKCTAAISAFYRLRQLYVATIASKTMLKRSSGSAEQPTDDVANSNGFPPAEHNDHYNSHSKPACHVRSDIMQPSLASSASQPASDSIDAQVSYAPASLSSAEQPATLSRGDCNKTMTYSIGDDIENVELTQEATPETTPETPVDWFLDWTETENQLIWTRYCDPVTLKHWIQCKTNPDLWMYECETAGLHICKGCHWLRFQDNWHKVIDSTEVFDV